jgi:hypothetical protein
MAWRLLNLGFEKHVAMSSQSIQQEARHDMKRTRSFPTRMTTTRKMGAALAFIGVLTGAAAHAETVTVGIGTQNTTTNTVTGGIVIEKLGLMDKYLA